MDVEIRRARLDAASFLKRHKVGVFSTVAATGGPHATTVYYTADDDFNVYLLTLPTSRKFIALSENPKVAFTVSVPDIPQTIQIEGTAVDITTDDEAKAKIPGLVDALRSNNWFYGPIIKLTPQDYAVVWIKPTWVRWADYAFQEEGPEHVLQEIPLTD